LKRETDVLRVPDVFQTKKHDSIGYIAIQEDYDQLPNYVLFFNGKGPNECQL